MSDHAAGKRTFERHPLEFEVTVSAISDTAKHPIEKAILNDISGNGACFLSNRPESYSIGQRIALKIHMPGTHKTDVRMEGQATVVWISDTETGAANQSSQASVGVSMDNLLSFQQHPRDTDAGDRQSGDTV